VPAQANVLSLLPGSCSGQTFSQPFSQFGDNASYTLVPGGSFEQGSLPWLTSGAAVQGGNESYQVHGASDSRSLALPAGSSATSPAMCTSIYHPTLRLFAKNTGAQDASLKVEVLYPGLLGRVNVAQVGLLKGSSAWSPTKIMPLLVTNLLATLSLDRTAVAYRFTPVGGNWSIDDVYVDPRCK
jgi:hypothetical protein